MAACPHQKPTAARTHYLDRARLAELVRDYQRTGDVGDDLGRALLQIAGGVWDRFQFTDDRDEFQAETVLHLLGTPLRKADPAGHLFNYFTTCAVRFGNKLRDKAAGERRRFRAYAEARADAGFLIPELE